MHALHIGVLMNRVVVFYFSRQVEMMISRLILYLYKDRRRRGRTEADIIGQNDRRSFNCGVNITGFNNAGNVVLLNRKLFVMFICLVYECHCVTAVCFPVHVTHHTFSALCS